ncbi:protein FAF-like, chloroplastic [Lotus japonicus]|uniref:protein FAF-like, chloroplastic n=1 Tax=Lotus japonicus TaxID=34305 RepID=UPI002587C5B1|nr:protein FAF-like, chloroplastic [Lotus japonicus]XP_057457526.1 protein FAF-like, chloroplastic [Lotus japonicus]XP_057457527.1 protein FAF-like, chloroplastic [Lotus japonicus]XP_057457528.1 protein FAF-like, chloroplastic [Lotus japonicus]XP_057457529.1 protein FAF-like, chloroplastic [Lotus japonicus]XP_057457530.1 protein FAF-like, chloroplastic [Lotus japonicus]XP_057457531.1 protein FAF-like, chloroplastic [Lotus japonicus]XP_057457532.1 protein FAF-like, chloroplastic [Lotus japoni
MSTFVSEKFQPNKPLKIEEETMFLQKQGIVTILASESNSVRNRAITTASLRRTLSADMSSKKWISQNPMKKTVSSEELSHSKATSESHSLSSSSEEDNEEMKEIEAEAEHDHQKTGPFNMWGSIFTQKAKDEALNLSPYVHPLVKKSKSFLSDKSLQICTESLGSETGSDGFSSYPSSETGGTEEEQSSEKAPEEVTFEALDDEELHVPKYNYAAKKSLPRSFPPPLSSQSLHMRPHRDNGRLFLQAVPVAPQNNFCAQRQDGRLVLTFSSNLEEDVDDYVAEGEEEVKDHVVEEFEEEFEEDDEAEEGDDEAEEIETMKSEQAHILSGGVLALMMNKPIGLVNKSPRWSEKFNFEVAKFKDVNGVVQPSTLPSSCLVPSAAKGPNPFFTHQQNHNQTSYYGEKLVVLRGKNGDYLVHNLKSCKDARRSFLFWEPYCIATS